MTTASLATQREVDIAAPTRMGGFAGSLLKFGMKVRDEDRTRDVTTISQAPASGVRLPLLNYIDPDYSPADNYLGGKYVNFGNAYPDKTAMRNLSHGGSLVTTVAPTGDSGSYSAHERVTAGYVMARSFSVSARRSRPASVLNRQT